MLAEFLIKVWKLFASHVLLNKRRLTGNRPGSARRETGRKKSLPQHPYLKVLITRLLLILEVCNKKPTYRISLAGNLLMPDLTFGPPFKVKRWFTGFVELSFRWIQICTISPIHRASFIFGGGGGGGG